MKFVWKVCEGLTCLALHRPDLESLRQREIIQPQELLPKRKLSITGRLKLRVGPKATAQYQTPCGC